MVQSIQPDSQEVSILQEKINNKISKATVFQDTLERIQKESSEITDLIAPLGKDSLLSFSSNGNVKMKLYSDAVQRTYPIHKHAIGQFGDKLNIPTTYLKKLSISDQQWERDLASKILNEHSENSDRKRILIRMLDNQVKGVLSDQYRRLNTADIYASFFKSCNQQDAKLIGAHYDDTRTYCEFIYPEILPIPTEHNGVTYMVFGLRISNSDYGDGALRVQAYTMQVVCLNGMTRENLLRQVHLGKTLPDNLILSEETYKLDTQTQASLVQDIVKGAFSKEHFMNQINTIQQAGSTLVNLDNEIKLLPKVGMLKDEVKSLTTILQENNPEHGVQGRNTLWKLTQAMTQVGVQSENGRRKRDIEDIAGKLLNRIKLN